MALYLPDPLTRSELESLSPEELRNHYALKVSNNDTLSGGSIPPSVDAVHRRTIEKYGRMMAYMSVEDYQGILQGFLVGLVGAKRILEIGTFTGTSAIFFAHALKRNGVKGGADETGHKPIITLDISEEFAETSRQNFIEAGVEDYIEVLVGDANEIIKSLTDITFDIAFVDADKISYRNYYETIVNNDMLNKNGLFIFDNTAFVKVIRYINEPAPVAADSKPLNVPFNEPMISDADAIALHEFNEYIRKDPRVEAVMLPLYTGITLMRFVN
ncbi:hypothetical protein EC988_002266 [Linderina pennispora]|nr:hypothetical protein EC988_002266 [Linderina pennispora]